MPRTGPWDNSKIKKPPGKPGGLLEKRMLTAPAVPAPASTAAVAPASAATTPAAFSAASAAAATPTVAAPASAGRTLLAGPGFIDRQGTALKILAVKHFNRFVGIGLRAHFDKSKAAGTTGVPVLHDIDRDYIPGLGKMILEIIFGGVVGEVANKQLCCHILL